MATMPTFYEAFDAVCAALNQEFGRSADDFQGLSPYEAMIAVVIERAMGRGRSKAGLDGLREYRLDSAQTLADGDITEIVDALRDKGLSATARMIAPLVHLARWVAEQDGVGLLEDVERDAAEPPRSLNLLRNELGMVKGIGGAAADAIVLHALKRPSYPVDRATFRVLVRHGWMDYTGTYDDVRDLIVNRAARGEDRREEPAVETLRDLSHGMERVGRQFCRVAAPHCEGCPLEDLLPDGGPREVDA